MLHKTSGIILHTVNYSETSLIVKIYTSQFGLQSYMLNSSRGKKSKNKANLLQPLALVDIIISASNKSKLQRITELNILQPYCDIPFNLNKSAIVIFLNEILYKSLKEEHSDINTFEFIKNSLLILDLNTANCSNYHVYFMMQLSKFLGFYPEGKYSLNTSWFDLQEGRFVSQLPIHTYYLNIESSIFFNTLLNASFENLHLVKINKTERKNLLQALILYYRLHINTFGEIKSLDVLEELAV